MDYEYKLTISLITMNRADQLREAVLSCVASELPEKTQFVIVDNASTDHTEQVVAELKNQISYDLVYRREAENRGVGGGRNMAFDLSKGEYVYLFDDDAVIPEEQYSVFFHKAIEFMEKYPEVALLTTEVEDKVFGQRGIPLAKRMKVGEYRCSCNFHGTSFLLRRKCFSSPLFMNVMYGNEEISVSMDLLDRGLKCVFMHDINIEHRPKIDKWNGNDKKIYMQGISNIYAIKRLVYPAVVTPVLYMAYKKRMKNNGITDRALIREFTQSRKEFMAANRVKKIRLSTVVKAYLEFGLTVF